MDARINRVVWRGMVAGVLMGIVPVMVGCVSRSAYEAEVEKNEHLRYVKTEQDIERDGLHADVGAMRRAYSELSLRTTFLEGLAQQTVQQLKGIDAKLSTLGQEIRLQQGDQVRVTSQGNETMRLLESLTARQEETRVALQGVVGKIDVMKKAFTSRPGEVARDANPIKTKVKEESQDGAGTPSRGVVQPVSEQKVSQGPSTVAPVNASSGQGNDKKDVAGIKGVGGESKPASVSERDPAISALSPSTVLKATTPAIAGKEATAPEAAVKADQDASPKPAEANVVSAKEVEKVEPSPLITSSGGEKPTGTGMPVKKSWGDWASEKLQSAKAKLTGSKPVQTAAGTPGSQPDPEKK